MQQPEWLVVVDADPKLASFIGAAVNVKQVCRLDFPAAACNY
jgi:hypothetical protein